MGAFASDVGQLPRIVTLNDVSIAAGTGKDAGTLTMDVTARTFRYLDDDEVAAQRRTASKKGPARK
jgi:type IV pilus assembly protein PilO